MNRRQFLRKTSATLAALCAASYVPITFAAEKKRRVGLIVLVGSPDHWHALHMIAAVEAGADVYCQKPLSRDVRESGAMLDAARKHNRVVQIGTQRKSTPHLIDAKKQVIEAGLLGKISHVEMCCYFHMRANGNPPVERVPDHLDYRGFFSVFLCVMLPPSCVPFAPRSLPASLLLWTL